MCNREDVPQLIRSSGSVGANYIEANESLGKKDFLMRLRIARKEAKESIYWIRLLDIGADVSLQAQQEDLIRESTELTKILAAIVRKCE
jgi:four helix bundle protein